MSSYKRKRSREPSKWFVASLLAMSIKQTNGFAGVRTAAPPPQRSQRTRQQQRYFRTIADQYEVESFLPEFTTATSYTTTTSSSSSTSRTAPWVLRDITEHEQLQSLQRSMEKSLFTKDEITTILQIITASSERKSQKEQDLVDYLTLLTETVDMGPDALMAAALYYGSSASMHSILLQNAATSLSYVRQQQVLDIARDACRLEELQNVASRVLHKPVAGARNDDLKNLILMETEDWRALALVCGACLVNLKSTKTGAREALHIYAPIASRLGMHRLKNELEEAAFSTLYPRQHRRVTSLANQSLNHGLVTVGDSMKQVLDTVTSDISEMLHNHADLSQLAENLVVTARVKEPYSMWRKMLRHGYKHILKVPDALALRVVFDSKVHSADPREVRNRERALCYYIQNLCMQRFQPNSENPRFKDYLQNPKPNGYQSLHYTAKVIPDFWNVEIQIRSGEMHKVAEYGRASHWEYKQLLSNNPPQTRYYSEDRRAAPHIGWQPRSSSSQEEQGVAPWDTTYCGAFGINECKIRSDRIRARTARLAPYIEAFQKAQSELARDCVFVFVSSGNSLDGGKILALPSGASVQDALTAISSSHPGSLIQHNGETSTSLSAILKNGDVLTMPAEQAFAHVL